MFSKYSLVIIAFAACLSAAKYTSDTLVAVKLIRADTADIRSIKGTISGTADTARAAHIADTAKNAGLLNGHAWSDSLRAAYKADTAAKSHHSIVADSSGKTGQINFDTLNVGSGVNHITLGASGQVLYGTAQYWDDMGEFTLSTVRAVGSAGAPTWTATGEGYNLNAFGLNDSLEGQVEFYHRFIEGDTLDVHLHYMTNGTDIAAKFVNWSVHFIIKNASDSTTYAGTLTHQDTIAANTKPLTHRIIDLGKSAIPNTHIGAYCFLIVKRIAASPATNPTANPFGINVGVHRKIDGFGSKLKYIK